MPLVQTTVVVQTLNHNTVKQWVVQKTALTTLGRTPQRRQVFISFLILSSGKGRGQRQLQTWLNQPVVEKTDFLEIGGRRKLF